MAAVREPSRIGHQGEGFSMRTVAVRLPMGRVTARVGKPSPKRKSGRVQQAMYLEDHFRGFDVTI